MPGLRLSPVAREPSQELALLNWQWVLMEDADGFLAPSGQHAWELGSWEGP